MNYPLFPVLFLFGGLLGSSIGAETPVTVLERIVVSDDGTSFVTKAGKKPFRPWGFNYLGNFGELMEEEWDQPEAWRDIDHDFAAMRQLGANVVRIHLQLSTYMAGPDQIRHEALKRLRALLDLSEERGLYLDVTGLGCYHPARLPDWFDALPESRRWQVQARFWEAIADTCHDHPAIFCYDLMNEPVITETRKEDQYPWLAGDLDGFYFVQRISRKPGDRDRREIAATWVKEMTSAIRKHDQNSLITVGIIPWALVFKGAKPVFYGPDAAKYLDFTSVHVYPKSGKIKEEVKELAAYEIGKPLVIEEFFPMGCNMEELKSFMNLADDAVQGWISHYFGHSIEEHQDGADPGGPITASFLRFWKQRAGRRINTSDQP